MRWTALRCTLACAALLAVCAVGAPAADDKKDDDGFKPLFNGKDFTGWKTFRDKDADPTKVWSIKDGVIICDSKPKEPWGYFYTDKSYKNYVIRYDWCYPKDQPEGTTLNSGLLVHIQTPHKVWPKCIEAQGRYMDHGKIFQVSGGKATEVKDDVAARKKALKPKEEWQTTEVTCLADGTIKVKVNGIEVAGCKSELTEGPIGFQAEGANIHFRKIMIKELK